MLNQEADEIELEVLTRHLAAGSEESLSELRVHHLQLSVVVEAHVTSRKVALSSPDEVIEFSST
jgi:hypothetical protein